MKKEYSCSLYNKNALLKAAYAFTDNYYVYLDMKDGYYWVEIDSKTGHTPDDIIEQFTNELLVQTTRENIFDRTKNIRELILARAFASTIIDDSNNSDDDTSINDTSENDDNLFKDWYDGENGKT